MTLATKFKQEVTQNPASGMVRRMGKLHTMQTPVVVLHRHNSLMYQLHEFWL